MAVSLSKMAATMVGPGVTCTQMIAAMLTCLLIGTKLRIK